MAKKKSSLSQALRKHKLQQQRAIKLASKKQPNKKKQPKQENDYQNQKPNPCHGHHKSQDSPIEITSTDRHSKLAQRADLTGFSGKEHERPAINR
ncbi:hypothetical protein PGTUg99_001009 [Puccinia graminis f. sp. tritici]|uniref:Uncharacterized protein n=1 Tax=Puccinia graminis f. sp. tritici TaxID=56615 RepID=A0A5B0RH86_PUCGR|nr:hypothetical protein PGTUg99_001009 [Puccinia graminis f. sp. tritici]